MYRVVLIDDEPMILEGLRKVIRWEDYQCEVAGTAEDAVSGAEIRYVSCVRTETAREICQKHGVDAESEPVFTLQQFQPAETYVFQSLHGTHQSLSSFSISLICSGSRPTYSSSLRSLFLPPFFLFFLPSLFISSLPYE